MDSPDGIQRIAASRKSRAGNLALALVFALVLILSTRSVATNDIGYHLAYGETFLDTGRIVDSSDVIYTVPDGPSVDAALELGPGCWYDDEGRYRFPNANWLSQIAMAVVWRAAGPAGGQALSLLLVGLVGTIFFLTLGTLRQAGLSPAWSAVGLLLTALAAQGRFVMRPEMFGYAVMSAQLYLLLPMLSGERPPSTRRVAALALLQGLAVNVHSYFLIGLALTGVVLVDRLLIRAWPARNGRRVPPPGQVRRISTLFVLQSLVCFANPWTWRLAWLPIQTLLYLRRAAHSAAGAEIHPWMNIVEFASPFSAGPDWEMVAMLALGLVAAVSGVWRRDWGRLLILVGMAAVAVSMKRNLGVAALLSVPVAVVTLRDAVCGFLAGRRAESVKRWANAIVSSSVGAIALVLIVLVVSQRFYTASGSMTRFGLGLSSLHIPVGPTAWINEHVGAETADRVWSGFDSSSNVHYFTNPHRGVPLLTNTWAMPPSTMREVARVNGGRIPFQAVIERHDPKLVCLEVDGFTEPLALRLAYDPGWAVVYIDAVYIVFLRIEPATLEIVRRFAINPDAMDVAAHAQRLRAMDPVPTRGLFLGGYTLARLGALNPAVTLLRDVVAERPGDESAWAILGTTLGRRAVGRLASDRPAAAADIREARDCFRRVLELDPDDDEARENMATADQLLKRFSEAAS